uniref:Zinc finger C2HC domain-containing protein 1A n=2 Tax=Ailuropoda melanoleuca TaxID=9646 RepID=G1LMV0_AILME
MGARDISGWEVRPGCYSRSWAVAVVAVAAAAAVGAGAGISGSQRRWRNGGSGRKWECPSGRVVTLQDLWKNVLSSGIISIFMYLVMKKKHGPICQKTATKKRKTFDSSRQRAEGTDIPTVKPLKPRPEPPKKPSNWRRKHEEFIATIRAAKGLDQALKEGGKLPPPPPPSYDPDYIQCPYCQRRFNENAADRHINFCKEQAARISNKGKFSTDTKGKATSRTQYKPPALKKSNSPGTAPSGSSRLPQPSGASKTVVGVPSGKVSSVSSSLGNKLQTLSPSHKGIAAPHVGTNIKPRNSTPPSLARNPSSGVLTNKRKPYTESYIARPDGDYISSLNGGNIKGMEGNSTGHLPKFCHECGTKYPVEWAKFCCECGIRRMVL